VISPARRAAYAALCRVEIGGAFGDEALSSMSVSELDERDRHLATEICYGTLRWRLSLDDILSRYSSRPWRKVDPRVCILLRMSLYQVRHTDRIPDHALVHDAVELGKLELDRGKAGFINGLLRSMLREKPWDKPGFEDQRPEWVRASLPEWLWQRWEARFGGERAFRYAISLNQPALSAFWNPHPEGIRSSRYEAWIPSDIVPGALLASRLPQDFPHWIQDEASQLVPHLIHRMDGCRIWDACASPGGKAAILSSLCGESGTVVASDLRWKRVRQMNSLLNTLEGKGPLLLVADAEKPYPFAQRTFDAVLADVPCSGLGTLRRNPEIKWRFQPERFASLQRRQLAILKEVAGSVRIGGALLYSTCSTEPEENEQVVEEFLSSHPAFRLCRPGNPPGVEKWLDATGCLRTFPADRIWDGFFAALMFRFS